MNSLKHYWKHSGQFIDMSPQNKVFLWCISIGHETSKNPSLKHSAILQNKIFVLLTYKSAILRHKQATPYFIWNEITHFGRQNVCFIWANCTIRLVIPVKLCDAPLTSSTSGKGIKVDIYTLKKIFIREYLHVNLWASRHKIGHFKA